MNEICSIAEEPTQIQALYFGEDSSLEVDNEIVSAIKAYLENGPMAPVTWFAVYNPRNEIILRINSTYVFAAEYE